MIKVKLIFWPVAMLLALLYAAPAFAAFEGTGGKLEGQIKSETTPIAVTFELGGAKVVCEGGKTESIAEIRFQEAAGPQQNALPRHQDHHYEKWGHCLAVGSGIEAKATVKACELRIEPKAEKEPKVAKALVGVETECVFEASACIVKVAPGKEEAPKTTNWGLSEDLAEDSGTSVIEKTAVTGVIATANSACELVGIKKTTVGKIASNITFAEENTV